MLSRQVSVPRAQARGAQSARRPIHASIAVRPLRLSVRAHGSVHPGAQSTSTKEKAEKEKGECLLLTPGSLVFGSGQDLWVDPGTWYIGHKALGSAPEGSPRQMGLNIRAAFRELRVPLQHVRTAVGISKWSAGACACAWATSVAEASRGPARCPCTCTCSQPAAALPGDGLGGPAAASAHSCYLGPAARLFHPTPHTRPPAPQPHTPQASSTRCAWWP